MARVRKALAYFFGAFVALVDAINGLQRSRVYNHITDAASSRYKRPPPARTATMEPFCTPI